MFFLHCYGTVYRLRILLCYVNSRVLVKKQLESRQRQLGKTAVENARGLHSQKDNCTWTGSC